MATKKKTKKTKAAIHHSGGGAALAISILALVMICVMAVRVRRAHSDFSASKGDGHASHSFFFSGDGSARANMFPRIKSRFWLGVRCRKADGFLWNKDPGAEGLVVRRVFRYTPAYMAGFHKGDVVLSFNGKELNWVTDLGRAVGGSKDQLATVNIMRDGKPMSITVTPTRWFLGRRITYQQKYLDGNFSIAQAAPQTKELLTAIGIQPLLY